MGLELEEAAEEEGGGTEEEKEGEAHPSALDCIARTRRTGDGVGAREFRLKRSCVEKHVSLRRRRCGSGPRGNVLVERRSGSKHIQHSSHLRCVPTPNVLVERRSGIKHTIHIVTCAVFQLPMSWLNAEAE